MNTFLEFQRLLQIPVCSHVFTINVEVQREISDCPDKVRKELDKLGVPPLLLFLLFLTG